VCESKEKLRAKTAKSGKQNVKKRALKAGDILRPKYASIIWFLELFVPFSETDSIPLINSKNVLKGHNFFDVRSRHCDTGNC
jgi:hypothetical protein